MKKLNVLESIDHDVCNFDLVELWGAAADARQQRYDATVDPVNATIPTTEAAGLAGQAFNWSSPAFEN